MIEIYIFCTIMKEVKICPKNACKLFKYQTGICTLALFQRTTYVLNTRAKYTWNKDYVFIIYIYAFSFFKTWISLKGQCHDRQYMCELERTAGGCAYCLTNIYFSLRRECYEYFNAYFYICKRAPKLIYLCARLEAIRMQQNQG